MQHYDVVIIGAGVSGMCAAINVQNFKLGSFRIFEKADDVGGTWRDNVYPGVECDVPSHLYSYSFELKADWSREYAGGGEIFEYLKGVATKYGIYDHVTFGTAIEYGAFEDGHWLLRTNHGETLTANIVISALGGLHVPNIPSIPGLEDFAGPSFHTSHWDDQVSVEGKRVAIIGTGATCVQCAPKVAEVAENVMVFQRTPVWVQPKKNRDYTEDELREMRENPGAVRKRRWDFWKGWEANGLALITEGTIPNRTAERKALSLIARQVDDPELRRLLTPTYNVFCKRPTLSDEYYAMFMRPNVELVTSGIDHIKSDRIVTADGQERPVDVIVLATGFKSFNLASEIDLRGEGGVSLKEAWSPHITTYRTVMAPNMPNLFFVLGPNSAGATSAFQFIESASNFIGRLVTYMNQQGYTTVTPLPDEIQRFKEEILEGFSKNTQNKGCTSWWTDDTGYPHANWPDSSIRYRTMLNKFSPEHFQFA